jgi:hypothetical protein
MFLGSEIYGKISDPNHLYLDILRAADYCDWTQYISLKTPDSASENWTVGNHKYGTFFKRKI